MVTTTIYMILTGKFKGKTVQIEQINFQDPHILHKLDNIGLTVGAIIKVLDFNTDKKLLYLSIYNVDYVLRESDCYGVEVKEISEEN